MPSSRQGQKTLVRHMRTNGLRGPFFCALISSNSLTVQLFVRGFVVGLAALGGGKKKLMCGRV